MDFITSLLASKRGAKILRVGGRMLGMAWPAVSLSFDISSILGFVVLY